MKKKILTMAIIAVMVFSMVGCGSDAAPAAKETDSKADAAAETIEEVKETEEPVEAEKVNESEEAAPTEEEPVYAVVFFDNHLDFPINGLFLTGANDLGWGDDLFSGGVMEPGINLKVEMLYYKSKPVMDMVFHDEKGTEYEFDGINFAEAPNPEFVIIQMYHDAGAEQCYITITGPAE